MAVGGLTDVRKQQKLEEMLLLLLLLLLGSFISLFCRVGGTSQPHNFFLGIPERLGALMDGWKRE